VERSLLAVGAGARGRDGAVRRPETVSLARRTLGEREAYLQGFAAGARWAINHQRRGRSADECEEFVARILSVLRMNQDAGDECPDA
jgi:hypothetical protein